MTQQTKIEWTDFTVNVVEGCQKVGPGCGARPMHPDWARDLRDQCEAAGTAFLMKQWGEWTDTETMGIDGNPQLAALRKVQRGEIKNVHVFDDHTQMYRLGKKAAGRLLDGREWNGFPEALA